MKIGIVSDTHFGYRRFYEDSLNQGREAIIKALENSDVLVHAGDMFDTRLPTLEVIEEVLSIWKEALGHRKPIIAIHGNHERRIKGYTNPVRIVSKLGIKYLHGEVFRYEKDGEVVNILGVGSVPEEHSKLVINKVVEKNRKFLSDGYNILVMHQMINEFDPTGNTELSMDFLESLGFDKIINGHIHARIMKRNLVIPGSTVITSLDEKEIKDKRGCCVLDTKDGSVEFFEIKQREIISEEILFENSDYQEVVKAVEEKYRKLKEKNKDALINIILKGSLKEGLSPNLIKFSEYKDLYVKNKITGDLGKELMEIKKSFNYGNIVKWAQDEIRIKLKDKIRSPNKIMEALYEDDLDKALEEILDEE